MAETKQAPETKPDAAPDAATRHAGHQAAQRAPGELPLVALRETVIFPEMIVPLQVGRDKRVAGPQRRRRPRARRSRW